MVFEQDGGRVRGGAVLTTLLQASASASLLVVAYYRAPLDQPLDRRTGWLFVLALLLFGALLVFQLRRIVQSKQPRLRAVRAVAVALPTLLVVFAATYCTIAAQTPEAFSEPLDRTDGLYFTVTVFSTVGLGDIAPVSTLARVLVTVQMLVGLAVVGVLAKLVLGAVQLGVARLGQHPGPGEGPEAHPERVTTPRADRGTVDAVRATDPARSEEHP